MSIHWYAWVMFIFLSLVIITGFLDRAIATPANQSAFASLLEFKVFNYTSLQLFSLHFSLPVPNLDFLTSLMKVLSFDFDIFQGNFMIVRWFLLAIFGIPTAAVLVTTVAPSIMWGFGQLLSAARSLWPF